MTPLEARFMETVVKCLPELLNELKRLNELLEKLLEAEQDRPFKGP